MLLHIIILITVIIISLIFKYYIFKCQLFQKQILEGFNEPTVIATSNSPALDSINSNQQDLIDTNKQTDKLKSDLTEQNSVLNQSNTKLNKLITQKNGLESKLNQDKQKFNSILEDNTAIIQTQNNNIENGIKKQQKIAADIAAEDEEEEKKNKKIFNALIYLPLEIDLSYIGKIKGSAYQNGNISFNVIDDRKCIKFNNSLANYIIIDVRNIKEQLLSKFTFCYWIYVYDSGGYTAVSLCGLNFNDIENPSIQCDFGGRDVYFHVALPKRWTSIGKQTDYIRKWTHVAYTVNQDDYTTQLYINGNPSGSAKGTGKLGNSIDYFVIGRSGDAYRAFNGYISHFFLFDKILQTKDINDIYVKEKDVFNDDAKCRYTSLRNGGVSFKYNGKDYCCDQKCYNRNDYDCGNDIIRNDKGDFCQTGYNDQGGGSGLGIGYGYSYVNAP